MALANRGPAPSVAVSVTLASADGEHELYLGIFNQGIVLEHGVDETLVRDVATGEVIAANDAPYFARSSDWAKDDATGIPGVRLTRCFIQAAS